MSAKKKMAVVWILVERRLIGRARLQVVGPNETNIMARTSLLVVRERAD